MSNPLNPTDYGPMVPYYTVPNVAEYLEFLQAAFGAKVTESIQGEGDSIMHAEVDIGSANLMMGQAKDTSNTTACMQYLTVSDVDAAYKALLAAGATSVQEPEDQFYGHRTAAGKDALGHQWWLAQAKEKVSSEELQKRADHL